VLWELLRLRFRVMLAELSKLLVVAFSGDGDIGRFESFFRVEVFLPEKKDTSSSSLVAAVELDRCEKRMRLLSAVLVYVEEREFVDRERLLLLMEPPKKSPIADAGRELKRFRESASRPNMDTFERAVGVEGLEFAPVRNSNRPI